MRSIHSKNTKAECLYRKHLWKLGYRYRINYSKLPGKPDVVIIKYKLAIFIDGEFWHGYDLEAIKSKIKSNRDYWIPKIQINKSRDNSINKKLNALGWTVLRFWEKEILNDLNHCVHKTISIIKKME